MRTKDYDLLPEGMSQQEVAEILDTFLSEQSADSLADKHHKLNIIGDKQWHTYEPAAEPIKDKVRRWILVNWTENPEFYSLTMGLCYDFGLEKTLFQRALERYRGDQRWEFLEMLERSEGSTIDTYASLRKQPK